MIKIRQRSTGTIKPSGDGFIVRIRGQADRPFATREAAALWLQKNAPKRYDARLWINGQFKLRTFPSKKAADDYPSRNSIDRNEGTYRELKRATFGEYAVMWKESHLPHIRRKTKKLKPSTLNSYISVFDRRILPVFENRPLLAIGPADLNTFVTALGKTGKVGQKKNGKASGLSQSAVRNTMNLLGRFFKDAISDEYLKVSPLDEHVARPESAKEQKRKGRALKPAEIQSLLANCTDPTTYLAVLIGVFAGLRRGEVFGLYWEDIDFTRNLIHVRRALVWKYGKHIRPEEGEDKFEFIEPKTESSSRAVDLAPDGELKRQLLKLFEERSTVTVSPSGMTTVPPTGLAFCTSEGRPLNPDWFQKNSFNNAVIAAQLGRVRFHDLRHTFGSLKLEQGESLYYVSQQMGHSSIDVTVDIYGHVINEGRPAAASKTEDLVFGKKK